MKRYLVYIYSSFALLLVVGCEKNDPITELGTTNGEFTAQLRVSYDNTRPLIGDTVIVTASTWQRDDKFDKVEFYETLYETFGVKMELENGTSINTKEVTVGSTTFPTLLLTDTVKSRTIWKTVAADVLDQFWVTNSNNYVIAAEYEMEKLDGKYPNDGTLIAALSAPEFDVLKSVLAYGITRADYLLLFPDAPSTDFTNGGTYALTQAGINNLKQNLTKDQLSLIIKSLNKTGSYSVTIEVAAITPTGATTSSSRTFDNTI
ncbi:hypothetical protein FAZ19_02505 [Sphingobacterium alkalisoli]|uniref:Uncharacterized protein n=1 Tax=Sphingobacterium alkalisoli TaxID=1874115 RepID=A0A4U0H8I9_9SPHI|nr:hypothetical protein [Sphingobacterium alkalisoli]TJY68150.1 hypothetical protein FAZ19_02505 [Sphingobacterium alkalisoli]GGH08702.1 hypothetical protein GCM10011418_06280 [Sphingobacterium alkalisoli]